MPVSSDYIFRIAKDSAMGTGLRRLAEVQHREPIAQLSMILKERLVLEHLLPDDDPTVFAAAKKILDDARAKHKDLVLPSAEARKCRCPSCLRVSHGRGLCLVHYSFVLYHCHKTKRLSEAWLVRTGRLAPLPGVEDYGEDFEPVQQGKRSLRQADAKWFFGLGDGK